MQEDTMDLWTVGHSNHQQDVFLNLLGQHQISVLADVRSAPVSKFAPHFNKVNISNALASAGIRYSFFGDTLGGRPQGTSFYDDDGHVLYDRVAASDFFARGIERLERGITRQLRIALMCSEENPLVCHRHLLVGRVLRDRGVTLHHIRSDGRIDTYADFIRADSHMAGVVDEQPTLFATKEILEAEQWRSILSVLPRVPQKTSSDV